MIKIAPSVLSADFGRLSEELRLVEEAGGADFIHIDVMDGVFVPNITVGPFVVEAIKRNTSLPLDVHLMITEPHRFIDRFVEAGADYLTVHFEACLHVHRAIEAIRNKGVKPGVALNPASPVSLLEEIAGEVDLILLMTVDPGFGGQRLLPGSLAKIRRLRQLLDGIGARAEISVDGGINADTAPAVVSAGAEILVAGSAVFNHPNGIQKAIKELRESVATLA